MWKIIKSWFSDWRYSRAIKKRIRRENTHDQLIAKRSKEFEQAKAARHNTMPSPYIVLGKCSMTPSLENAAKILSKISCRKISLGMPQVFYNQESLVFTRFNYFVKFGANESGLRNCCYGLILWDQIGQDISPVLPGSTFTVFYKQLEETALFIDLCLENDALKIYTLKMISESPLYGCRKARTFGHGISFQQLEKEIKKLVRQGYINI